MRGIIFQIATLGALLALTACRAPGADVITMRNGKTIEGDILGFKDGAIQCGIVPSVRAVPIRDIHSIKLDGRIDMAAFVMKNGQVIEGTLASVWAGKATLTDERQIVMAEVRESFLIHEPVLERDGAAIGDRIGVWLAEDPDRRFYAVVLERIEGQTLMRRVGRMRQTEETFINEVEPGVKYALDGDPPDKFMKIAPNGDLESWVGKRRISGLKPFRQPNRAERRQP